MKDVRAVTAPEKKVTAPEKKKIPHDNLVD